MLRVLLLGLAVSTGCICSQDPPSPTAEVADASPEINVGEGAGSSDALNIVLVLGCTVRKDQMSPYGGPDALTPFLSSFATQGTLFENTIAAAPWTRPASTALLTGHHAISLGMVEPSARRNDRTLPVHVQTIAQRMQAAGWFTIGASANPNLNPVFGFDRGFDSYQEGMESSEVGSSKWKKRKLTGARVADAMLQRLRERTPDEVTKPFFLRMLIFDTHLSRQARPDEIARWSQDDAPELVATYRHTLHTLDAALGHLDAGLKDLGYDETNTLFVFIADHGEGLSWPNHHGYAHGSYLASSTVHVPWMMRGPGVAAGHRVQGLSSQVDLLPTLLALANVDADPPYTGPGRDWSAQVSGTEHTTDRQRAWSDTWFQSVRRTAVWTNDHQCQRDFGSSQRHIDKGKFVEGCYDLASDPHLSQPIEHGALFDELGAWREARLAEFDTISASVQSIEVDPELARQLEILGYAE